MFEDVEKKIKAKRKTTVRELMEQSLPQIYNALNPSAEGMATQTRMQMTSVHEELKQYRQATAGNPESTQQQRQLFQNILDRVKNISKRVKKIR